MSKRNILYSQSGGVTPVINATACGVIETARSHSNVIGKVYAAKDGIIGALQEELIDTSRESNTAIAGLKDTPGGALFRSSIGSDFHILWNALEDARDPDFKLPDYDMGRRKGD